MQSTPSAPGHSQDTPPRVVTLRTGIWHDDRPLPLAFPAHWDVQCHWPHTPPPLSDDDIRHRIEHPVSQPPLRTLARGRRRVGIITDDLSRPTPVHRILPFLMEQL